MKKENKLIKYLIRILKREPVRKVKFKDEWISLEYDGAEIRYKIVTKKHEPFVGSWSRQRDEVYVDNDIKDEKEIEALVIHEAIEKYVTQRYGLRWNKESHQIALVKEKEFLRRIGGDWEKYLNHISWVWRKEGRR